MNGNNQWNKESKVLTKQEIVDYWETKPLFVEREDGSDSLLQENGYSLKEALDFYDEGCDICLDE